MTEETPPPSPLPPAAEAPYPLHPAPHGATQTIRVAKPEKTAPAGLGGLGGLGATLIGGALAATIGLLIAIPFLRRRSAAKPQPKPRSKPKAAPRRTQRARRKTD